jgi:hypothetical protein
LIKSNNELESSIMKLKKELNDIKIEKEILIENKIKLEK